MQTFLSSFDLKENAKCLDSKRLFKQLVEASQIFHAIAQNKDGWRNHPARKQWEKYPIALFWYLQSIWLELQNRKIAQNSNLFKEAKVVANNLVHKIVNEGGFGLAISDDDWLKTFSPNWWNREDISSSHRSRLRCKGFIDAACADIKRDLKLKSINRWLKANFKLTKNQLKFKHLSLLKETPGVMFKTESWYEQFGWKDDPAAEYVWPM
jgi:Pyrimidine dimer DNA glycosylase